MFNIFKVKIYFLMNKACNTKSPSWYMVLIHKHWKVKKNKSKIILKMFTIVYIAISEICDTAIGSSVEII